MIHIQDKSKCCGCHACYNICPTNAITMQADEKGFKYPVVDKEKCINCGLCEKVCPILHKPMVENFPQAFAVINKNEEIRKESSSGGVFSLIAETILNQNGVIFGAAFNENFMVEHIVVRDINELYQLRTSKYVQSNIGETYKKAKEYLDEERKVLFTGTPCQINGLLSFLQKDYENLYTQDIICHGVPSPKVWKKYLDYRKKQDSASPVKINFRQKDNGWNAYEVMLQYKDKVHNENHNENIYIKAFLNNFSLRDSCYDCSFKDKNRISDITLADFWGIDHILPEMNDDKGTSLVWINSKKGQELFEEIKAQVKYQEVDFEEAVRYNPSAYQSVQMPKNRENFFEDLDRLDFAGLVKKYVHKKNIVYRVLRKLKNIVVKR